MNYYGPCQAMLDAGITDPQNKTGIDFCLYMCPYPNCIFDTTSYRIKIKDRRGIIRSLRRKGRTPKEIAETLSISVQIIYRNLR